MNWKWIVLEEDPRPDEYIAVIAVNEERLVKMEMKPRTVFETSEEALKRARLLRECFNVKGIRIFFEEGNSAFLKRSQLN